MKKVILSLVVILAVAFVSAPEAKAQIIVNAGVGLPMGDFGDIADTGFGGEVSYLVSPNDNMKVGGTVGYFTFNSSIELFDITYAFIPVKGTFEYLLGGDGFTPYLGAEAGLFLGTGDLEGSDFGFTVGGGAYFSESIKAGLKYQSIQGDGGSLDFLSITVGYAFGGN